MLRMLSEAHGNVVLADDLPAKPVGVMKPGMVEIGAATHDRASRRSPTIRTTEALSRLTAVTATKIRRLAVVAPLGLACLCSGWPASSQVVIGPGDRPETGLQGQTTIEDVVSGRSKLPYHAGVRLVGRTDIWNRGGNLQLSWVDQCAYVSTVKQTGPATANSRSALFLREPAGVAVIDVRDPRAPKPVRLLRDRGSIDAVETMHAIAAPGRKVLVAGAYSGGIAGRGEEDAAWLSIYDASNCLNPKLQSEFKWPANIHMVTISPNGRRVYGTEVVPGLGSGKGGLHVLDISDMKRPRYLGRFGVTRPNGLTAGFTPHEVSISHDERRIYAAVLASETGDVPVGASILASDGDVPVENGSVYILDNSDIVDGRSQPKMRLVGEAKQGGFHSVVPASINGVPHLVGAAELGACPGTWPRIINIADEKNPKIVGEFKLQMNIKENCDAIRFTPRKEDPYASFIPIPDITARLGAVGSHFNDVDDARNTRLGLFPFFAGGVRIVDLRDPTKPVEVGYYKPGANPDTPLSGNGLNWTGLNDQVTDGCMSHVRYVPESGHIWFACVTTGFHVVELNPDLRARLGFPTVK